jgi:hypothetical protein
MPAAGRVYTATFKAVAVTAQQDFFEIAAPADAAVEIISWSLSQSTEVGDAQEEQLTVTTNRGVGTVTSGSGGTTQTPQPVSDGDPAFGGTVEANNTTKMVVGSGTLETDLEVFNWNVRVQMDKIYTPEDRPMISPSNRWTLELETTPADSITISGTVVFREIGG